MVVIIKDPFSFNLFHYQHLVSEASRHLSNDIMEPRYLVFDRERF